ncbi:MAG: hypothetical protein ACLFTH_00665 [Candidatus Woesearchaeota archaeon]
MAISNKTLSVLLIAAIVVSVGGTFFSLMMLNTPTGPTGFNTQEEGEVILNVPESLSITLEDSSIDFGDCTPDTTDTIYVDSFQGAGDVDNSNCSDTGSFPDNMTLVNNGNVDALVNLTTSDNASALFGTTGDNGFAYKVQNQSSNPGCAGTMQQNYLNFTDPAIGYDVCSNLTAVSGQNRVEIFAAAWLSPQAAGGGEATWTFDAYAS